MSTASIQPTQVEVYFDKNDIIVSKTDTQGVITYTNKVFLKVAGYGEEELLGRPHNIIRHPDMPRCVFHLLWKTLSEGNEIFAYVKNMTKNGDFYWVHAHVTPTFAEGGKLIGYHSNRRVPDPVAIQKVDGLYEALLAEEKAQGGTGNAAIEASTRLLLSTLESAGMDYDEFVFSL